MVVWSEQGVGFFLESLDQSPILLVYSWATLEKSLSISDF